MGEGLSLPFLASDGSVPSCTRLSRGLRGSALPPSSRDRLPSEILPLYLPYQDTCDAFRTHLANPGLAPSPNIFNLITPL